MNKFLPIILCVFAFSVLGSARAETAGNLLKNGDFGAANGLSVMHWVFPLSPFKAHGEDAAFITRGGGTDERGNPVLQLATIKPIKAHVWWQQEVEALGGSDYQLSVRMVATVTEGIAGKAYAGSAVGIYFLNAQKKWIGFVPLASPREFSAEWTTVSVKATAPDDAMWVGVRLGMNVRAQVAVHFDDAVLTLVP